MLNFRSISLSALAAMLLFTACSSSKGTTSSSFLQKRKYRKGWHLDIPERHDSRTARIDHPAKNTLPPEQPIMIEPAGVYEPTASTEPAQDVTVPITVPGRTTALPPRPKKVEWSRANKPARLEQPKSTAVTSVAYDAQAATPEALSPPEGGGRMNTWAIVGFICSLFLPLLGLIFSIIALNQIKRTGERGHGLALAGLIISIVTILIVLAVVA